MEYLLVFGILGLIVYLTILTTKSQNSEIEKIASKHKSLLSTKFPGLFGTDYSFYTNNHPYVWGEVSEEEMSDLLARSARGIRNIPMDPPVYCYEINQENKRFYFIPAKKKFNFSSLMHYQEWLDSQKEVADKIAKFKSS